MFKTAKNTIKNAARDQVEFFLALLTGVFVGSIFTLVYIKFWEQGEVTFADIGGMLAGTGTIGLLLLAFNAGKEWKNQLKIENTIRAINEFQEKHDDYLYAMQHLCGLKDNFWKKDQKLIILNKK
ncbi:hypothetical protein GCM10009112_25620 [Marinomonas arenicola]|uniref:hypothetical protein n=1 Tax=Marinomonas TaxID=28253 RepID=UPI00105563D9|nr:hypothetical protein [Marinomonas sp. KMM3893]